MAPRGPKPKSNHLHVVDGTFRNDRHSTDAPQPTGSLAKPKYLKGRASALWDEIAGMCWWLGDADSYKLGCWCALQAEFEKGPSKMTSARISQLRALGSELGLDPASRSRLGSMRGNRKVETETAPPQEGGKPAYFDS